MPDARAYWRTRFNYTAECQGCDWWADGANGQGIAAQHHDRTGHVVRVEVTRTIYYGEDRPRVPRWWKA